MLTFKVSITRQIIIWFYKSIFFKGKYVIIKVVNVLDYT